MEASPIHVHVQDNTPVHVHVKKPKSAIIRKDEKPTRDVPYVSKKSAKPTAKSRSKSINGPWIPAPGKTSLRDKSSSGFKWDSGRSQLEVNMPHGQEDYTARSALKMADLSNDDEDRVRNHIQNYEKKVEELMKEVGTLRNEIADKSGAQKFGSSSCKNGTKKAKDHSLILSARENKLKGAYRKNNAKKKWYEIELSDVLSLTEVSRPENFHARCFEPLSQETEVEKRVKKALKMLMKNCKNEDDIIKEVEEMPENSQTTATNNSNIIESKTSLDNVIYFDSSYRKKFDSELTTNVSLENFDWTDSISDVHCNKKVELKKIEHELEDREEQLEASKMALEDRQREIDSMAHDYQETERENNRLRKSVERIKDDLNSSMNVSELGTTKDALLKKLIEVELDGATCGKQVAALRDVVSRLRYDNRISAPDAALLTKERELLMQKIEDFESSNRALRHLLQAQHEASSEVKRLEEHRNTMIQKVADSDSTLLRLKSEMTYMKNELDQVLGQLSEEKNHTRTLTELNKSVDATRAHLQRELRAKEMENNRLQVQLRNMERDTTIAQKEAEDATVAAKYSQETIGSEKEALKKATRAQRQRADRSEQVTREIEAKLSEREHQLASVTEETETWKSRYHRAMDDRARAENQVKSLSGKLDELESMLRRNENKSRDRESELTEKVHRLTSDTNSSQLESERLKGELRTTSEKLRISQDDATAQRAQVQQYETLNSELRASLAKTKNEAEEALLGAERAEREARRMREQGSDEIERVRKQMLQRMKDLQPLPELLKETEMKLQDAQDQIQLHEKRSSEQTRVISELTSRDELQSDDVEVLRQKISALKDENRALEARLDIIHTKLDDRDNVLRESAVERADKDENIQTLQMKIEEKTHLCNSLQRQLDAALEEVRKTAEMERDKAAARERAAQARIADLETQVTRGKTDAASVKRSKVDTERRLQSQLQDARDRLEQSESTNRSMRNYVTFLKSSYNTVFGTDASLTSSPIRDGGGAGLTSPKSPY